MWIVEIDEGCWLAPWDGDPGRTLVKESAQRFTSEHGARTALGIAIKKYAFRGIEHTAKIERIAQ